MKTSLLLAGLLFASSALAQSVNVTVPRAPQPPNSGRCGTQSLESEAKCACYKASQMNDVPDVLLNACRQAFGDDLASLANSCRRYIRRGVDGFARIANSHVRECTSTFETALQEMAGAAGAPTAVRSADVTAVARPIVQWPWPYPFYWCWGWGWWWWWWIIRFYLCVLRHGPLWWRYCRIFPWLW